MTIPRFEKDFNVAGSITVSNSKIEIKNDALTRYIEAETGFLFDAIYIVFDYENGTEAICCAYTAFDEQYYIYFPIVLSKNEIEIALSV